MAKPLPSRIEDAEIVLAPPEETWWTQEREDVFKYHVAGWPKTAIAEAVSVNRNTVARWIEHDTFQDRLHDTRSDTVQANRTRRQLETVRMTDKLATMASKNLELLATKPGDFALINATRAMLQEYRAMRGEERADTGDNVQKHAVIGMHQHNVQGQFASKQASQTTLKDFLAQAERDGHIDSTNATDLVQLTADALLKSDLLQEIAASDQADMRRAQEEKQNKR